jgi:(heptosyl)LPS beta-1,4-glucosyltransferase
VSHASPPTSVLPISVLLLLRDERRDVEELLPSLAFAAEVVVVWDPRGDRAARDTAERLGARVFERAFDGFGPQRAFALAQCTQPWVLWLDADERLTRGSLAALARVHSLPIETPGVVRVRRETIFLGAAIHFCGWRDEWLPRLFTRHGARFDDAPVHEQVELPGAVTHRSLGRIELVHHSYRTIDDCVRKMVDYARANAEKSWRAGRRAGLLDVIVRPPLRFLRQFVLQLGFLDGAHGFVLCAFAATQVFLKYAELWARSRAERPV